MCTLSSDGVEETEQEPKQPAIARGLGVPEIIGVPIHRLHHSQMTIH